MREDRKQFLCKEQAYRKIKKQCCGNGMFFQDLDPTKQPGQVKNLLIKSLHINARAKSGSKSV
jgi:hypothetical protein